MPARTPPQSDDTTTDKPPMFEWTACPMHPWYGHAAAIVVRGGSPWCIGDAETVGHWVDDLERAA